jgi:hypothetical protein
MPNSSNKTVFTGKMHYPLSEKDRSTFETYGSKASSMH